MNHIVAQSSTDIIAMIGDEPVTELPTDLFIPPEALTVLLEQFSGPLDLLLYLIRKQNIDILDIISIIDIDLFFHIVNFSLKLFLFSFRKILIIRQNTFYRFFLYNEQD